MAETYDYGDYADTAPTEDAVRELTDLAQEQREAEDAVAAAEEELKRAKARLQEIAEHRLPERMESLGFRSFTTANGLRVELDEKVRASIPRAKEGEAFAWLDEHGHSSVIKREFTVRFGRGEESWAKKFAADLRRRKKPLNVQEKKAVHAQTLSALVRELLESGEDVPEEALGVYRQRYTKVK